MKQFRAGVIGCGNLGKVHTESVAQLDGMDMVAFCDVVREKAQELCQRFGGEYHTADADKLLKDPSLDAIYVCTHHDTHAELCIRAAREGKNLLVEKPLALTVEECVEIGRTVEQTGVKLFTAFKMRYYDMILKAKELIPRPLMVHMQMLDNRWPDTSWANDPKKGGGNVLSQGCHSCDILRYVMGSNPVEVYAAGGNFYTATGVIDNVAAVFRFENGGAGCWLQGDCNCPPFTSKFFMQVLAENKSVTLDKRLCHLVYSEGGREPVVCEGSETGMLEENRAFIQCLQNDTRPAIDHVDGLMATLMMVQACNSLQSGKPEPVAPVLKEIGICP